jgi:hypothetical protein
VPPGYKSVSESPGPPAGASAANKKQTPTTCTRQLDFVFASANLANRLSRSTYVGSGLGSEGQIAWPGTKRPCWAKLCLHQPSSKGQ